MTAWREDEIDGSLGARFERVAAQVPALDAVHGAGGRLTYAQLHARARALARRIVDAEERRGRVAVLCGLDTERAVAVMGVLLSGRVLVTLDASYPDSWTRSLLEHCDAAVLVTDSSASDEATRLAARMPAMRLVRVDGVSGDSGEDGQVPDRHARASLPEVRGRDLATILYTSGSTGVPKGVMRPHDSLLHTAWLHAVVGGLRAGDRFGSVSSTAYARALGDLLASLLNGACLYLYDFGSRGVTGLGRWIAEERITSLNLPAAVARQWNGCGAPAVAVPDLRDIRFSGAAANGRDVERLLATLPGTWRAWASYASSEAGSVTRAVPAPADALPPGTLHVGAPVAHRVVVLLDDAGAPVPPGEPGEVAVRGRFMATGYWRRPELTAACFRDEPDGTTSYRTGDLGRFDAAGHLHLLGRRDDVVKVRGFTVALPEVEAALSGWSSVAQAAVLAADDGRGGRELIAFVAPAAGAALTDIEVRRRVAAERPAFMVPRRVVVLPALPLLENGKPDRRALSRMRHDGDAGEGATGADTLDRVRRAWRDVLGQDVSDEATFLEQGGDSFAAAALELRLSALFGRPIELADMLRHPTIAAQARWIDSQVDGSETAGRPSTVRGLMERPAADPLYMLPAIDGTLTYALRFAPVADRFSVYGVEPSLRPDGGYDAASFADLAVPMAACIAAHAGGRRITLMGPCGGGKLGLEVAARLRGRGTPVARVVVVEAPGTGRRQRGLAALRDLATWGWQACRTLVAEGLSDGPLRPLALIAATARTMARRVTRPRRKRGTSIERRRRAQFRLMSRAYRRGTYDFPVLLVRGAWSQLGLRFAGTGRALGWERHCPQLTVRFVPGTHASMYEPPFVASLARVVDDTARPSTRDDARDG